MSTAPVDFTHDSPGRSPLEWQALPGWEAVPSLELDGVRRVVVVAAHPDDESLGAGGLVATLTGAGIAVDLVVATDGEGSHPGSPTHTPDALALRRRAESHRAWDLLGGDPGRLHHLGVPDGGVADHEARLTTALVDLVGDGRDAVLVAPWRHDGHPDHEAAGRAAAAASRRTGADLAEYAVWWWHWGDPALLPFGGLRRHTHGPDAARAKACAIAAHASQVGPLSEADGDQTLLGPGMLAHSRGRDEHFWWTEAATAPDTVLDELHRDADDPWGVETRWYERRKRALTLAVLPRERFRRGLEVGCSTGGLAADLAARCDRLLALDRSPVAVGRAQERLADLAHVEVAAYDVPGEWPIEPVDLVVVSEVGYFLSPRDVERLAERVAGILETDGVLVLCHWRHQGTGYVLDGAGVHALFERADLPPVVATYRDDDVEVRVHAYAMPEPSR